MKLRVELQRVRGASKQDQPPHTVTAEDIVETVAARAGVTPEAVRAAMHLKNAELIAGELASQIPFGGREWVYALVTCLAGCSSEEAEQLCSAIRAAKARIDQL